jgi:hypothetical protein
MLKSKVMQLLSLLISIWTLLDKPSRDSCLAVLKSVLTSELTLLISLNKSEEFSLMKQVN